jgi:hypothetical protein
MAPREQTGHRGILSICNAIDLCRVTVAYYSTQLNSSALMGSRRQWHARVRQVSVSHRVVL